MFYLCCCPVLFISVITMICFLYNHVYLVDRLHLYIWIYCIYCVVLRYFMTVIYVDLMKLIRLREKKIFITQTPQKLNCI